ncbi:MAG: prolipoprotein diacylglyceryl transferase [Myxococcota bacterium]
MRPVLLEAFGVELPSFAVMMTLGFVVALYVVFRQVGRDGVPEASGGLSRPQVWDLYLVMVMASLLGAKFGHVLFEAPGHKTPEGGVTTGIIDLLKHDPWHWARITESGWVWYGGLVGALLTAVFYFWRRPALRAWLYADAFAPAIAAGAVVGRMGCFLAGCCHGRPSDVPWAMKFTTTDVPVHPTQIYDGLSAALLFTLLWLRFPRRRFDGEAISLLMVGYAILRFVTEAFRGDADRGAFGSISTSQAISIPMLAAGLILFFVLRRRKRPAA